ncbi:MAG: hypothetical protein R3195_17240 [Gemmatimonadota bacterium]|nr:hypothetical protein [Gemmatimonadota bacterium]
MRLSKPSHRFRTRRSSRANRICPLAAIALTVGSRASLAQAGDIERVPIVLGSPVVYGGLPFDEPFYLTGRTGSLVDSVGVRLEPASTRAGCAEDGGEPSTGGIEGSWARTPGPAPDSFYIRIDELPPDRVFRLCVSTRSRPDPDRLASLHGSWRTAIDSAFRRLPSGWSPEPDDLAALKTALLDRIGPGAAPAEGSLLDPGVSPARLGAAVPATGRIVAARLERDLAIDDIEGAARAAVAALDELTADRALSDLAALRTTSSSRLRAFASLHRAGLDVALELRSMPPRRFEAVFRGDIPWDAAGGAVSRRAVLDDVWESDVALVRERLLADALEKTRDLAIVARAFAADEEALELTGLTLEAALRMAGSAAILADETAAALGHAGALRSAVERRSVALDDAVDELLVHERATISVEAHTSYDLETSARNHVAADFGMLYLPGLGAATPVLGANFYFRPVNRDRGPGGHLLRRLSLSVAVTTTSLEADGLREDLFGSLNLAVGLGARLTRLLRLSGGVVMLREVEPDSAAPEAGVDATRLAFTPYAAVTLDFVARSLVSSLFGEVF